MTNLARLRAELTRFAGPDQVLHLALFDDGNWIAHFNSELGALRAYAGYGGGTYFGTRRPTLVEDGPMAGTFMLTNHAGTPS